MARLGSAGWLADFRSSARTDTGVDPYATSMRLTHIGNIRAVGAGSGVLSRLVQGGKPLQRERIGQQPTRTTGPRLRRVLPNAEIGYRSNNREGQAELWGETAA